MARYTYVALDAKGKEITGEVESDSSNNAVARIREMGYFPTNVTEARAPTRAPTAAGARGARKALSINITLGGGKVKSKILTTFTRQLATLIDAGLPLLRGLNVLRNQEKNPVLKRTLGNIAEAVESGSTFSEALAQHPKIFNKLYVNMVRAGEA
ncbi:MAG: type II secretion system F family protein, partial [Verrucomicrobiae bacterium]|nr:type II secretion system F family protein [Verrucomicrobiae bacterium]MDW8344368.1 type II secretion system F family protein [Verrucomicrobiae bacterium]